MADDYGCIAQFRQPVTDVRARRNITDPLVEANLDCGVLAPFGLASNDSNA